MTVRAVIFKIHQFYQLSLNNVTKLQDENAAQTKVVGNTLYRLQFCKKKICKCEQSVISFLKIKISIVVYFTIIKSEKETEGHQSKLSRVKVL